jgi:uncharacterized protein YdaU (DUF1376 family)
MPFWVGDYLRDTQHLTTEQHGAYLLLIIHCWQHGAIPPDDVGRAQVARLLPVSRWNKIKAPVEAFFEPDGTHRRVIKERARVEHLNTVRRVAGSKGGFRASAARFKNNESKPPGKRVAIATAKPPANGTANTQQKASSAVAYQTKNQNLTSSSEYVAARARTEEMPGNQDKSAGSLATALDGSALTRPPVAEPAANVTALPTQAIRDASERGNAVQRTTEEETPPVKPPSQTTREELEAMFAGKRAAATASKEPTEPGKPITAAELELTLERQRETRRTDRVWGRGQQDKQEPEAP